MIEGLHQFRSLLPAMWRQRWWALAAAVIVGIAGVASVMSIPAKYQATARVYVDTQSILKPLMEGLAVRPNVDQQVAMMARTLVSRPNVERVVRMADLDLKAMTPAERDALIDGLIRKIQVRPSGGINLYSIDYQDSSPDAARRVVQSLLSIFVEANLGDKRRDSEQARRFIDEQIALYEKRLVEAETALKDFKIRNLSVMPNLAGDYVTLAGSAQRELDGARLELRQLENSREALRRQLADEKPTFTSSEAPEYIAAARGPSETEQRLEVGRKRLDDLLLRYTDDHPDVVNLRRMLRDLEVQRDAERRGQTREGTFRPGTTTVIPNKVYQDIKVQLADVESKIAALRARVGDAEQRLREARAAAQTVPKIEAEYTQLTRDYDVTKKNYEQLIARRESAALSGDMDSKSGIGEFRVVDPPRVGSEPVSPKRPVLLGGVLGASLAAGLGLAFLLSQLKPTFFDGRSLREFAGMPLLGTVSIVRDARMRARARWATVAYSASGLTYVLLFGALIAWVALRSPAP
jgi:polysaccharide chain length determinant protein (PEP-CTERM system associated)